MKAKLSAFFAKDGAQKLLASLLSIVIGLAVGSVVVLIVGLANPAISLHGAWEGIRLIFAGILSTGRDAAGSLTWGFNPTSMGNMLFRATPLIMTGLSVAVAYKAGLFNIGAAGQYCAGAGMALYAALAWHMPWWLCMIMAMLGGALLGVISGLLKSYCNVNEVISGIMLNWITLYVVNILLTNVKEAASPYTMPVAHVNGGAIIPSLGLGKLFNNNQYVTLAIPLAILIAVGLHILLEKTRLGYELKATGNNKNAAKYCGMAERRNLILTLAIGGALAGLGAAMLYLTGYEQWQCSQSSVPAMGFNGIAVAFLGGLSPIGSILSAFFIQYITTGGGNVDLQVYCSQISSLISALIIYLCAFVGFFKYFIQTRLRKADERKAAQIQEGGEDK